MSMQLFLFRNLAQLISNQYSSFDWPGQNKCKRQFKSASEEDGNNRQLPDIWTVKAFVGGCLEQGENSCLLPPRSSLDITPREHISYQEIRNCKLYTCTNYTALLWKQILQDGLNWSTLAPIPEIRFNLLFIPTPDIPTPSSSEHVP